MDPMWIVLGIMLVFVIGMLSNKYSFGTVTVGCLVLLVLFGIQTPTEAFSGFGSGQIILMGGMFVISYAFGKTSVVDKVQALLFSNKGAKSDLAIAAIMLGFTALLCQFVTSVISVLMIMMSFLAALGHKSSVTASRMMLPVTFIASIFVARFPIGGGGASAHVMVNALLEGAGAWIGIQVQKLLGGSPAPIVLLVVFSVASIIMTTFMSNFVTMMVLSPIAIQVCAACGYDSRAVLLCIHFLVWAAVITPMASPATALAYGTAGLSVRDTIKWTIPAVLIATVSVIVCSMIAYPM